MLKPLTVWITTNCGKFFKRWEYQITLPAFWEICVRIKKQQLEPDIEQQTGSKLGKEYVKAVYCHLAFLTYMQRTSWETLGWMKSPWTARRSNQSILKEISPECSLEGLMLMLKLQYFCHLIQITDSLGKTLMLGKIEGRRRRGWQRMRCLDGITDFWTSLSKLWELGDKQGNLAYRRPWGHRESDTTEWLTDRFLS